MTSRAVDHHLENIIGHRVLIELLLGNKILLKHHLGDRVLLDGDLFQMGSTVSGGDQPENLLGDRVLLQNNLCVGDLLQSLHGGWDLLEQHFGGRYLLENLPGWKTWQQNSILVS